MERLTPKNWKEIENHCYAKELYFSNQFTEEQTDEMIKRLAEYEDKLESGELLELPCKVGDSIYTVYLDDDDEFKIAETQCIGFNIREDGVEIITGFCCYNPFRYGKFTNKSQAECRLAELQAQET